MTWARIQTFVIGTAQAVEQWPTEWVSYVEHGVRIDAPDVPGHILIPWHNVLRIDHVATPTEEAP